MLETAMLKVFSTEVLWQIINDTIQIFGGKAYFTDEPYERLMRDARINTIGEGANDVLRAFIALVGMRDVGLELQGVLEAAKSPWRNLAKLGNFAGQRVEALFAAPTVSVVNPELETDARRLGKLVALLGTQVQKLLAQYREAILDRQYQQRRIADAATEIFTSALRAAAVGLSALATRPARRRVDRRGDRRAILSARRRQADSPQPGRTDGQRRSGHHRSGRAGLAEGQRRESGGKNGVSPRPATLTGSASEANRRASLACAF